MKHAMCLPYACPFHILTHAESQVMTFIFLEGYLSALSRLASNLLCLIEMLPLEAFSEHMIFYGLIMLK